MPYQTDQIAPIYRELRGEFLDTAREKLDDMLARFRGAEAETEDADAGLQSFLRSLHSLKGQGSSFGFHSLSVISHLLEDRMCRKSPAEFGGCTEIVAFLDRMTEIVETGVEPAEGALEGILAGLDNPYRAAAENAAGMRNVAIVSGSGTITQLLRFGLEESGFRSVSHSDPYTALPFIVRTRPDAVVCTAELVGLSGFDLVHALVSMPATGDIPVALLTSHGADHPRVKALPRAASCVHVGPDMIERLVAAFGREKVPA